MPRELSIHDARARLVQEYSPDGQIWQAKCSCGWESPDTWTRQGRADDEANTHLRQVARKKLEQ